jgi:hypothetical protein
MWVVIGFVGAFLSACVVAWAFDAGWKAARRSTELTELVRAATLAAMLLADSSPTTIRLKAALEPYGDVTLTKD